MVLLSDGVFLDDDLLFEDGDLIGFGLGVGLFDKLLLLFLFLLLEYASIN